MTFLLIQLFECFAFNIQDALLRLTTGEKHRSVGNYLSSSNKWRLVAKGYGTTLLRSNERAKAFAMTNLISKWRKVLLWKLYERCLNHIVENRLILAFYAKTTLQRKPFNGYSENYFAKWINLLSRKIIAELVKLLSIYILN